MAFYETAELVPSERTSDFGSKTKFRSRQKRVTGIIADPLAAARPTTANWQ